MKKKKVPSVRKSYGRQLEEKIRIEAPENEFITGEIVLGTIPGYAPWPARIHKILNETIFIYFFGTGQMYVSIKHAKCISLHIENNLIFYSR